MDQHHLGPRAEQCAAARHLRSFRRPQHNAKLFAQEDAREWDQSVQLLVCLGAHDIFHRSGLLLCGEQLVSEKVRPLPLPSSPLTLFALPATGTRQTFSL
eukprot:766605-Hanusia_phi.AAC.14